MPGSPSAPTSASSTPPCTRAGPGGGFFPNDEISALFWWDGTEPLTGRLQILDVTLARLARAALR